jgi:hypothetical protein
MATAQSASPRHSWFIGEFHVNRCLLSSRDDIEFPNRALRREATLLDWPQKIEHWTFLFSICVYLSPSVVLAT